MLNTSLAIWLFLSCIITSTFIVVDSFLTKTSTLVTKQSKQYRSVLYVSSSDEPRSQNIQLKQLLQTAMKVVSIAAVSAITLPSTIKADDLLSNSTTTQQPQITQKVYIDIKIANYTEESRGKNRAGSGSGRVVLGLYGKQAPESVELFLRTIKSNGDGDFPTFYNGQFSRVDENGVLQLERLRGLNTVQIAGTEELEYNGNLLNFKPILETNTIKHNRAGLLTRKQLTAGPEFGLTLRPSAELDAFHVVFGEVLEGQEVLDVIGKIPTYSYKTKTGYGGEVKGIEGGLADSWFEGQKSFYVGVGRAFGDLRAIDRRGKLLRRVTIKGSGLL